MIYTNSDIYTRQYIHAGIYTRGDIYNGDIYTRRYIQTAIYTRSNIYTNSNIYTTSDIYTTSNKVIDNIYINIIYNRLCLIILIK